jgi:hypothetical protein
VHIACDELDLRARHNTRSVFLVGTPRCGVRRSAQCAYLPRVRDENVGPIFFFFDKSRSNRIEENASCGKRFRTGSLFTEVGTPLCGVRGQRSALSLPKNHGVFLTLWQLLPACPTIVARFLVRFICVCLPEQTQLLLRPSKRSSRQPGARTNPVATAADLEER